MANDDDPNAAVDRWVRTAVGDIRRFQSLRPRQGRVLRRTPMPREVKATLDKSMAAVWPLTQTMRDGMVDRMAQRLAGQRGYFGRRHGAVPEPEARRAAAAAGAEGFAAISAFAAGKSLDTDEERADAVKRYTHEVWRSVIKSRLQGGAGTSRAGPAAAALPPPPDVFVSGPVQQPGLPSSSSAPRASFSPY